MQKAALWKRESQITRNLFSVHIAQLLCELNKFLFAANFPFFEHSQKEN